MSSCKNSKAPKESNKYKFSPKLKREFLNIKLTDTITINKQDSKLCLNENLDSLINKSFLEELRIVDLNHNIELINWHPFMGNMEVNKINEDKFEFVGKIYLPNNGDWDNSFQNYELLKYHLELYNSNYKFSRTDQSVDVKFNLKRLNELKEHLTNNRECFDQNWEVANDCFDIIEEYEYQLFAALMNQNFEFKSEYLSLRKNISIVNAGQFSEYLEGNYLILALLGIITKSEYDLSRIIYNFNNELAIRYCY